MNVYPCERLHRFRVRDTSCSSRRCNWHAHGKRRPESYHLPVTELPRLFLFKVYNTICGITYTKSQEWRSPLRSSKSLQKEPQRIWKAEGFTDNYSRRFFETHANNCNNIQALRTRSNYLHLYKQRKILSQIFLSYVRAYEFQRKARNWCLRLLLRYPQRLTHVMTANFMDPRSTLKTIYGRITRQPMCV
jgi:hypothetical protein